MNAKMYNISEIFYSLQGEGMYTGKASVFIRLAKCNLACPFCDTEFDTIAYCFNKQELESFVQDLLDQYNLKSNPHIVFTGGEPTLQLDEKESLFEGFYRCIETNGYKLAPQWIDWVTFSPKTKPIAKKHIHRANEIKLLYGLFDTQDVLSIAKHYPDKHYFIQAIDSNKPIDYTNLIHFCKTNPNFRLSLQTHKFLAIQ